MSPLHSVHFTLDDAQMLLERIRPMIDEMVSLKKKLGELGYDVYRHSYFGGSGPNGKGSFPEEMEKLINIVKAISFFGVHIKSLDKGLIDFPHVRSNGEEVYLCWMQGEENISFWHTIPEGFAGRRNVSEL